MVKLTVGTDGLVQDATLIISTGYSRLDAACLKAFRSEQFLPVLAARGGMARAGRDPVRESS